MAEVRTVGTVTVRGVASMTKRGRKGIADWLRRKADDIESDTKSKKLAPRFTANFCYVPKPE